MNKKYLYFSLLWVIIIFFWFYHYNNSWKIQNNIVKDSLIKNLNWDSPLQSEVPYVIWNEIELYYILNYNSGNNISVNLELLRAEFDISEIKIWDITLEIADKIDFIITENTPLKISWIAKNNSNAWEKNLRDLIKISAEKISEINSKNTVKKIEIIPEISIQDNNTIEKNQENKNKEWEDDIIIIPSEIYTDKNNLEQPIIEITPEEKNNNLFSDLNFNQVQFNSNINNLLEISWKNIEKIKFLNIGSYSFTPNITDGSAYFLIKKNTFDSGNYFVFIQPKQWNIVPLDIQMNFQYSSSKVNIANITPNQVNNNKDSYIVLQWNWFNDIISLQLSNNIILKKTSFEIINDKVLSVKIDKNIEVGSYSFNIMTTNDIIKIDNMSFTIIK